MLGLKLRPSRTLVLHFRFLASGIFSNSVGEVRILVLKRRNESLSIKTVFFRVNAFAIVVVHYACRRHQSNYNQ